MDIEIVIRPSGIWNSRAPLHNYILARRDLSRTTCYLTLATYTVRNQCMIPTNLERSVDKLLGSVIGVEAVASQAWVDYRRSFGKNQDGTSRKPIAAQLAEDAYPALQSIREMSIVRLASLFEAFSQCWALNLLLAHLETDKQWTKSEKQLAERFHPIYAAGHVPGWPDIVRGFPLLRTGLAKVPSMFTDPRTGEKVTTPPSKHENAFDAIQFWRSYRNLAIHTSCRVTRRFHSKFHELFSTMTAHLDHTPNFEPGQELPMHDDFHSAMAATQYRAAIWMNEYLTEISNGRRGHPEAPSKATTHYFEVTPRTPPLLVAGDHDSSWQWASDAAFRQDLARKHEWNLQA